MARLNHLVGGKGQIRRVSSFPTKITCDIKSTSVTRPLCCTPLIRPQAARTHMHPIAALCPFATVHGAAHPHSRRGSSRAHRTIDAHAARWYTVARQLHQTRTCHRDASMTCIGSSLSCVSWQPRFSRAPKLGHAEASCVQSWLCLPPWPHAQCELLKLRQQWKRVRDELACGRATWHIVRPLAEDK